jgi:type I restriction enzyme S subunit
MSAGFDVQKFVESFPALVAADGGPTRLRQLVLDLAVSGGLTADRRTRDSALELLADIDRLRSGGREVPDVSDDEKPRDLPTTWCWSRLGIIGRIVGGGTPKTGEAAYWASDGDRGAIPWLTPADLYGYKAKTIRSGRRCLTPRGLEESSARLLPAGSILFSSRAPIGYVAIVDEPLATNQGFKSVVPWIVEMSEYIYVFLRSAARSIDAAASGTTFKEVSGKDVSLIPIPVPPLAEQKRIVAKVDELMKLIDDLEARQAKQRDVQTRFRMSALDALTKAQGQEELAIAWKRAAGTFEVLFERSDGVSELRKAIIDLATVGRLTGWRTSASSSPGAADLVPLPTGWRWADCVSLCDPQRIITYGVIKLGAETAGGVPTLRSSNVRWLRVDETGMKRIAPDLADEYRRTKLRGGEVVLTVRGTLGGVAVVPQHLAGANVSREVAVLPFAGGLFPSYMAMCVASPRSQQWLTGVTKGIAYEGINIGDLRRLPLPVPPLAEQKRIVSKVDALMKLCDELEAELKAKEATAARLVDAVVKELVA